MNTQTPAYDPTELNRQAPAIYARLESLCKAAERARKKLARAKKCPELETPVETVADSIVEAASSLHRRKLPVELERK